MKYVLWETNVVKILLDLKLGANESFSFILSLCLESSDIP